MHAKDRAERAPLEPSDKQLAIGLRRRVVATDIRRDIRQAEDAEVLQTLDLPGEGFPVHVHVARPGADAITLLTDPGAAREKHDAFIRSHLSLRLVDGRRVQERISGHNARHGPGRSFVGFRPLVLVHLGLGAIHPKAVEADREEFLHDMTSKDLASFGVEGVIVADIRAAEISLRQKKSVLILQRIEGLHRGIQLRPDDSHEVDVVGIVKLLDHRFHVGVAVLRELVGAPAGAVRRFCRLPEKVILDQHIDGELPLAESLRRFQDLLLAAKGVAAIPEAIRPLGEQFHVAGERAVIRHERIGRWPGEDIEIGQIACR